MLSSPPSPPREYQTHKGAGERCLQGNRWFSPPVSMTSRLASVTFKTASKVLNNKNGSDGKCSQCARF